MGHFGGQQEGGHAPANVISKGDYYIMTLGAFRVWGLGGAGFYGFGVCYGFGVWGLGFGGWGLRVKSLGCGGVGFEILGAWWVFRVLGACGLSGVIWADSKVYHFVLEGV